MLPFKQFISECGFQLCFPFSHSHHTNFFILFDRHPVRQRLESHLQVNADAFCDELTTNLMKLEKVTLYDMMHMPVMLIRFFLNFFGLFF